MAELTRRSILTIASIGGLEALTACGAATRANTTTPTTPASTSAARTPSATSPATSAVTSSASATAEAGYQPTGAVLNRIQRSGLLFALQGKPGVSDVTGVHAVVVGDEPIARMKVVRDAAEVAWSKLRNLLGPLPPDLGLILAPRTGSELQQWSGLPTAIADIWGITIPGATSTQLPFVILDCAAPGVTRAHLIDDDQLITHVVTHELFHAYTLGSDIPVAPLWVVEGFAELAGQRATGLLPTQPLRTPVVPTDEQLRGKNGADYYFLAWMLVDHLASRYGDRAAIAFYRQLIDSPGTSLDEASRAHFATSWEQVVARWKAQYASQLAQISSGG